ncbi:nitronate monooxygenase [Schumannella luteola]|uniref:Propionate 3-nitronate monooxygenase n=1 Tax=Schumannella luteola TaxID=472059 RepID=A0A852YLF7_9MICO|nr:nitronate monooxygenase [Schumannella luteola]NYG98045.1 NAD(P)H-dependent flavin oxidoreductase YrpB (nitropropane dioxygenase family) [Schumannella luteola]TPX01774.1 nitronate monooxygenase [Schumannella luteola]
MTISPLITSRLPIVAAPMAGGATTVALAIAAAEAGAFPFLAAGYKSAEAIGAEVELLRASGHPFGVNLFVPSTEVDAAAFAAYAAELQPEADVYDLALDPTPVADDDHWAEKIALLVANPVPVVSLTFGLPPQSDIATLQGAGSRVLATVTNVDEAAAARDAGVDGLIVQGSAAGGHSAIFEATQNPADGDTAELVHTIRDAVDLPVIGAGGVGSPDDVQRILDAGAEAVAVGTLLLLTDEAGTSPTHRAALADPAFTDTVITRAFTGRPARALRSAFVDRHDATAITAYPAVHHLTRVLRATAGKVGDAERLHLWAGAGWQSARPGPVADVIHHLAGED